MKPQTQPFLPLLTKQRLPPIPSHIFRDCKSQKRVFWGQCPKHNQALGLLTRMQPQAASASPPWGSPVPASSGRHISGGFCRLGRLGEGHRGQQPLLSHAAFAGRCWEGMGRSQYWESSAQASSGFINSWLTPQAARSPLI